MKFHSQIPLTELDWGDDFFRSSLDRDPSLIGVSMKRVGLQVPVKLQEGDRGYRLISGFLRAEAALTLGLCLIEAHILPQGSPLETFLSSLHENTFTRGFSWVERTWILEKAHQALDVSREVLREEFLPAMGLKPSERLLKQHLDTTRIPLATRRDLARNGCSLANAVRISSMNPEDQKAIAELLSRVHLTESGLRECLELIWEIGLRDGVTPRELVREQAFWHELQCKGYNKVQKGQALRDHLLALRMPHLSSLRKGFQEARSSLGLPNQISVNTDPSFERKVINFVIRTRSPEEFRDLAQRLWKASLNTEAVKGLFSSIG